MELSPILLCLLAAVPVLLLIILLVGCKWSVGRAAVVSVVVDAVIALSAFGAHPLQILVSAAKGAWSSLSIILIICPAILMYNIVREAGAFRVIRAGIQQATPNKLLQILIIGYAFAAFLQGITGFGVPVAICAPLLIEIGVSPLWALAIAPLGEAWGNTFGTLSAAWDALAAQAGLNEAMPLYWQSALWTAALLFAMNLVSGLLVCWFYGRGAALRRGLPAVLVLSLVQGGGELLMSQVNTTLCCFIPCCLALVVSLLLGRLPLYNTPWELENSRAMEPSRGTLLSEQAPQGMGILHAFSPYLVMTAFSLVCLLIPSVKRALAGVSVSLHIPAVVSGGDATSPGGRGIVRQGPPFPCRCRRRSSHYRGGQRLFSAQPHQRGCVPVFGGRLRVLLFPPPRLAAGGQWAAYSAGQPEKSMALLCFGYGVSGACQYYERHRPNRCLGGWIFRGIWAVLCGAGSAGGNARLLYHRLQYVQQYPVWQLPDDDGRTGGLAACPYPGGTDRWRQRWQPHQPQQNRSRSYNSRPSGNGWCYHQKAAAGGTAVFAHLRRGSTA